MRMRLNVDGNETTAVCKDATSSPLMRPNAGCQLLPKAEARNERTLEAVSCTPWLGQNPWTKPEAEQADAAPRFPHVPNLHNDHCATRALT